MVIKVLEDPAPGGSQGLHPVIRQAHVEKVLYK